MSDTPSTKKSIWRSPAVYIAVVISCFFLGFFYLAVTNEPDYMPSQNKPAHSMNHSGHADSNTSSSAPTAAEMNMTEEEHAAHGGQPTEKVAEESSEHGH